MSLYRRVITLACCAFIAVVGVGPLAAQERGAAFRPLDHLPPDALVYLSVESAAGLRQGVAGTLWGRIVSHPGWQRAFAGLGAAVSGRIDEALAPVVALTGKTPLELLGLLQGQVALSVGGPSPAGIPEIALAIELGASRGELLGVVKRLRQFAENQIGQPLPEGEVGGATITTWALPGSPPLQQAVLGDHLVVATDGEMMRSIVDAFRGRSDPAPGGQPSLRATFAKTLAVPSRQILLAVDVKGLVDLARIFAGPLGQEQVSSILQASGLDGARSLGWAVGFEDGGARSVARLELSRAGGLLRLLQESMQPIGGAAVEAALARMPATAYEVSGVRVASGRLLAGLDALVRQLAPDVGPALDGVYEEIRQKAAVSIREDVFTLGDVTVFGFTVDPPAGSLFADRVMLLRTDALAGYWKLLRKVAGALGAAPGRIETAAGAVEYINLGSGLAAHGGLLRRLVGGEGPLPTNETEAVKWGLAMVAAPVARADLGDGWSVVSFVPQGAIRYLTHYRTGPRLAVEAKLAALARTRIAGASAGLAFQGGHTILWLYNTLLGVANSFAGILAGVGVDMAQAPPAETFLEHARPGFLQLGLGPDAFTLESHRGLESQASGLVAISGAALVLGFVVPTLTHSRAETYKVQCSNNIRELSRYAMVYADTKNGFFPDGREGPAAAWRPVIDFAGGPGDLPLESLVCPAAEEMAADSDENGKYTLGDENVSYEFVPWRLNLADQGMLIYEKRPYHGGGRNVVFTDGHVEFIEEGKFQEMLRRERERHTGKGK